MRHNQQLSSHTNTVRGLIHDLRLSFGTTTVTASFPSSTHLKNVFGKTTIQSVISLFPYLSLWRYANTLTRDASKACLQSHAVTIWWATLCSPGWADCVGFWPSGIIFCNHKRIEKGQSVRINSLLETTTATTTAITLVPRYYSQYTTATITDDPPNFLLNIHNPATSRCTPSFHSRIMHSSLLLSHTNQSAP